MKVRLLDAGRRRLTSEVEGVHELERRPQIGVNFGNAVLILTSVVQQLRGRVPSMGMARFSLLSDYLSDCRLSLGSREARIKSIVAAPSRRPISGPQARRQLRISDRPRWRLAAATESSIRETQTHESVAIAFSSGGD